MKLIFYRIEFNPLNKNKYGSVAAVNAYTLEEVQKKLKEIIEHDTNCKNIGLNLININRIGNLGCQQFVYEVFDLNKNYQLGQALATEI